MFLFACSDDSVLQSDEIDERVDDEEIEVIEQTNDEQTEETSEKESNKDSDKEKQTEDKHITGQLTVHYLDVGQADATLFLLEEENEQYVILYDTGDWQGNEVVTFLKQNNIDAIDVIIISHPHADHIGQLADIVRQVSVDEVWMTANTANTNVYADAIEAILENDVSYDETEAGEIFDIGALTIEVLHPETLTGDLNEDSLSVRFTYGKVAFLFTGDAYEKQELEMIERNETVQANILQLGHHGSNTSSNEQFLKQVNPEYAIYSAEANNSYGHPSPEVVERVEKLGITLLGTDVHGTITVTSDGKEYDVMPEKTGEVVANKITTEQNVEQKTNEDKNGTCIDLNEDDKEQLMEIIHIGDVRADEIIKLRPFSSVDDLTKVKGIGPSRIQDIKEQNKACVGE